VFRPNGFMLAFGRPDFNLNLLMGERAPGLVSAPYFAAGKLSIEKKSSGTGERHRALQSPMRIHPCCGRSNPLKLRSRIFISVALLFALTAFSGCKKKQPAPPSEGTAPPATTAAPTAELTAQPTTINSGDQVTLSWHTTDANTVSIDGIGDVPSTGVKTVTPTQTTTYHLVARGDGGSADASAVVTVNAPVAVSVPSNSMSEEEDFKAHVQDIFFDYDTYDLRSDAQATLSNDANWLIQHPDVKIVIGGYCDERGSDEYNLALGQKRATAAMNALVTAGVAANRIRVISYGKEKPFCTESNEQCWQLNRRAGFSIDQQ
jgi:peptidoglycan-associated lipoprotein